jgi:hypothetical protein
MGIVPLRSLSRRDPEPPTNPQEVKGDRGQPADQTAANELPVERLPRRLFRRDRTVMLGHLAAPAHNERPQSFNERREADSETRPGEKEESNEAPVVEGMILFHGVFRANGSRYRS